MLAKACHMLDYLTTLTFHRLHKLIIESVTNSGMFVLENSGCSVTQAHSIALYDL